MKTIIQYFLLSLLFVGCSADYDRSPSSDFEINQSVIQDTFDIPVFELNQSQTPSWSALAEQIQSGLRSIEHVTGSNQLIVKQTRVQLPEGVGARIVPDISEDGKFILTIEHSNDSKGTRATVEAIFEKLNDKTVLQTYYDFFEWAYNIKQGDADSIHSFHKIKAQAISTLDMIDSAETAAIKEQIDLRSQDLDNLTSHIKRERRLLEKARKDLLSELDRAGESEQLKRLVAEGKRAEVADLLEKYLPREQMAPFESKFWDQMVDVIRNPVPVKDRILVFRGIDEDMVYGSMGSAGKELTKEEAVASSKAFMMSSMMTKNQGTWNRRLRSLQTMNEKFLGSHNTTGSSEWTSNFRISTFFKQHSRNPQGSPFLSFTPKIDVAVQFGRKRTAAYLVDPRALLANATTGYTSEFEFLTSLVTFPDELVDIYDEELHGVMPNAARKERFLAKTREIVDNEESFNRIKTIFDHFNSFQDVAQLEANVKKEGFFSKIMSYFKKKPAVVVEAPVDPTAKSCTYVLKFLWNL
tara:strand:- start:15006 stop:16580 length:1575 start_codon:yes stop_codon:yes gene_type:complete